MQFNSKGCARMPRGSPASLFVMFRCRGRVAEVRFLLINSSEQQNATAFLQF
jgi:hypothetical protein